jgi:PBP1b-binding outer membrane lipoprotein LpoB
MIKKMEKKFKNIFYIILILVTLNGCQSVKEGLTGQKKNNTDEFLIQKKNPLIQPPEFNKLPEPYNVSKIDEKKEGDINFSGILTEKKTKKKISSNSQKFNKSIEKSILEKIKSN